MVIYVWTFGLALLSYIVARFVLDGYPHPYHWSIGVAGGVLGAGIGWL